MSQQLTIGLFGFGVVGEGIYNVLQQTPSLNANIKKICIKHPDKKRNVDTDLLTTDPDEILQDPEINLVVELINDADAAYTIVTTALQNKKAVVSANKKLIADHLAELLDERDAWILDAPELFGIGVRLGQHGRRGVDDPAVDAIARAGRAQM